jgi:hypothetical protein
LSESLLRRWSRLKRAAAFETARSAPAPVEPAAEEPPDLPPIEQLAADSDYTAFLARAVPEELQRLALRRAWATDPRIAAFRGFAEYDWDCNAAGYGALLPVDDIARLCDAVLRPPEPPAGTAPEPELEPERTDVAAAAEPTPAGAPWPPV